tara:strand:- start:3597 stop:5405 length:1809 start_codon:yes stop_codon:yes gene_type:complete
VNKNLEFNLPQDAYVNFDALSLKSFIVDQLNAEGNFTDQNYEGSNMSSLVDILAYYTHVLMFYLNQTSTESMFSQATIYENMNKIVKLIGYKPTGKQTSLSPIDVVATSSLTPGNYNIRKYSYFLVDNIQYTFINDDTFEKVTALEETIDSITQNTILYQGSVGEYPIYTSDGVSYETIPIVVDNLTNNRDTRFISNGTISIYVKESKTDTWYEYDEVNSLFLSDSNSRVFDLRLNENGHYEVKFGNDVFGKSLVTGDEVAIYYILSDGDKGQISKNAINGNKLFTYNSNRFNQIYSDVDNSNSQQITANESPFLIFSNPNNSTSIQDAESVEQIRENSPVFLSSQLRLVTETDYEKYLLKSIPNVLNDVKVVNNETFIDEYIKYFYDICVDPNKVNRVILNQVNFADSCDFNNINVFGVPTFTNTIDEQYPEFLSNSFKTLIKDITKDKKIITNEVVPRDPIYVALDFGITNLDVTKNVYQNTKLIIVREQDDKTNKEAIKRKVVNVILDYFSPANMKLGQRIDLSEITSEILSLRSVRKLKTSNTEELIDFDGVSFVAWNPMFEGVDETLINQTTTLPYFKYPYIYRPNSLISRIDVIDE